MLDESCQTDRVHEPPSTFRERRKRGEGEGNHSHQISQSTLIGTTLIGSNNVNESDTLWNKSKLDFSQDSK